MTGTAQPLAASRAQPASSNDARRGWLARLFREEMAPIPGRLNSTLRMLATMCVVVTIGEVFQLPDIAISAYVALIFFKAEAYATIGLARLGAIFVLVGIFTALIVLMATLSEPAIRIPWMATIAFASMYLSRASSLGPAAFIAGLFMFLTLSNGDDLISGALGTYNASNLDQHGAPDLLYMSPEEAMLHNSLWLALAFALAASVAIVISRFSVQDPERVVRDALASHIETAERYCLGDPKARAELAAVARRGSGELVAQNALAGRIKQGRYSSSYGQRIIVAASRITLTLLAFSRLPPEAHSAAGIETRLKVYGQPLSTAAKVVRLKTVATSEGRTVEKVDAPYAAAPLLAEMDAAVDELRAAVGSPAPSEAPAKTRKGGLLQPDAFTNPAYVQFGLKVALAVMICYVSMNLSDWSKISTCTTTCFVLATDSVGQSFQKVMLRISGAILGAAIGFVYILLLMPLLTDIGQLILVMTPVLFLAAWIRAGSARVSYAGQQLGFAFLLMMIQDFGPTTDFQTGRDRAVGILVGEIVYAIVFVYIWPESITETIRRHVATAFDRLSEGLSADRRGIEARSSEPWTIIHRFNESVVAARSVIGLDSFEPERIRRYKGRTRIDADVLMRLQSLGVPVAVLAQTRLAAVRDGEAVDAALGTHEHAMAAWFHDCAEWVRTGGHGCQSLVASLPQPPPIGIAGDGAGSPSQARAVWFRILDDEIREVLYSAGFEVEPSRIIRAPTRSDLSGG